MFKNYILNCFYLKLKLYSGFFFLKLLNYNNNYINNLKKIYYNNENFNIFLFKKCVFNKFFLNSNFFFLKGAFFYFFYFNYLKISKNKIFLKNSNFLLKFFIFNKFFFWFFILKSFSNFNTKFTSLYYFVKFFIFFLLKFLFFIKKFFFLKFYYLILWKT